MPITQTLLTASVVGTNLAVYTTASITPTANRLVLASLLSTRGGTVTTPTLTGCGLTWVLVHSRLFSTDGGEARLFIFRAMGASPSAEAVTITYAQTQTVQHWSISEFDGVDTGGTNGSAAVVQSAVNSAAAEAAGAHAASLSAFGGADNRPYGCWGALINSATQWTPETDWDQLSQTNSGVPNSVLMAAWRDDASDTSPSASHASTSDVGVIALEIKAAASGSTYNEAVTDAASASDAITSALTAASAATEAATATDAQTSALSAVAALTEAATGADTAVGLPTLAATATEAADATDASTVIATLAAVLSEAGTATDAAIGVMTMAAALTEAASASETVTWGSVTYDVDLTEAASASDAVSAVSVLVAVLADGGTAADAIAAVQLLGATITELGTAADAATGVMVMGLSITEAGAASDVWLASIPSTGPAPTSRTWLIASESRVWLIPAESRT